MKLKEFSPTLVLILLTASLAGTSIYLNSQKKTISNEMKSQLTSSMDEKSADQKPKKLDKLRTLINKNFQQRAKLVEASPSPIITQERFFTEKEIEIMTEEDFKGVLEDIELRLPKISDIKKIPAEALHRTPEALIVAGKNLGFIKEIINTHSSFEKSASGFYENCAKNEVRPTPVRALCLTNLSEIKKKSALKINLKEYPVHVVDLARTISDL